MTPQEIVDALYQEQQQHAAKSDEWCRLQVAVEAAMFARGQGGPLIWKGGQLTHQEADRLRALSDWIKP